MLNEYKITPVSRKPDVFTISLTKKTWAQLAVLTVGLVGVQVAGLIWASREADDSIWTDVEFIDETPDNQQE